ncbi:MAG TPA: hemerythrin domain-containing protein [Candidatus Sulfotelmatobacter sp.]|nr:hemerythrin domain-containing protein [Candidatus Sulfotelmatobacter sp.]
MDPLEVLMEEHEIILRAIKILDESVSKLKNGKTVPNKFYDSFLDITKNFIDRCHHAKEETVLFPLIKQRIPTQNDDVAVLYEEHTRGRLFLSELETGIRKNDHRKIIDNSMGYIQLLTLHIKKENMLFPDWMKMLSDDDKADVFERFEEIEERVIGLGKHEEYALRIEDLKSQI